MTIGAAVLLSGCSLFKAAEAPVAIDTFCLTAKKRTWSPDDTPETVRDAEVYNATIDKRCGIPGGKAKA